jgi:hypothetical protein
MLMARAGPKCCVRGQRPRPEIGRQRPTLRPCELSRQNSGSGSTVWLPVTPYAPARHFPYFPYMPPPIKTRGPLPGLPAPAPLPLALMRLRLPRRPRREAGPRREACPRTSFVALHLLNSSRNAEFPKKASEQANYETAKRWDARKKHSNVPQNLKILSRNEFPCIFRGILPGASSESLLINILSESLKFCGITEQTQ